MIYLMVGIPGSGKSTYIRNHLKKYDTVISRDEIRFSLISQDDEYFSKEKEVFKKFIDNINHAIQRDIGDVYIDATHLNKKSRDKVVNRICANRSNITPIFFKVPLNTCLERNAERVGRAIVPENIIISMYNNLEPITAEEGFKKTIFIK